MNSIFRSALLLATASALTAGLSSCSDDPDDNVDFNYAAHLDYSAENAEQWGNYMVVVSNLLKEDATTLYDDWNTGGSDYATSYAALFKNHDSREYGSALSCVEEVIDGCADIASEVGSTKIGDPYNLYVAGKETEALYAVESWYSWHSRDDYRNNILSIRNSYYGSLDGTVHPASLSAVLATRDAALDRQAKALIDAAAAAIHEIPQPFRSHINSAESRAAMEACADLEQFLTNRLKPYFQTNINDDATLDPVVAQYVDGVVLPTYRALKSRNEALDAAVNAFREAPSDAAFEACAQAWLEAREPWEMSEAFLFGPVADKGLDPNMDSWPLDQTGIVNVLKSQAFSNLNWSGLYDKDNEQIAGAQNLRGFHTLEYFIFKNGKARTTGAVGR